MLHSISTSIAALMAVSFLAVSVQNCSADLVVSTEFLTGETLAERTVAPGEVVSLNVFLSETAGLTNLEDFGLSRAGLRISPGDLQFAGISAADAFSSVPELDDPNPGFDNMIDANGDLLVTSQALSIPDIQVSLSIPVFPTDGRVELGHLNLVVPSDAAGSLSFQIEDSVFDPTDLQLLFPESGSVVFGDEFFARDNVVLDFTGTLQVSSVPEPAASLLLVLTGIGLGMRRKR